MNFLGAKRFYIPFLKPSPKNGAMILPWRAKRWSDTRMHSTLGGRRWFPWQQHPCSDFPRLNWNILKYLLWAPLSRREMSGFPIPQACSWGEIFSEFDASEWGKSSLQAVKSPLSVFAKNKCLSLSQGEKKDTSKGGSPT